MTNTWCIAKKEFQDLSNSPMVLVILIGYAVMLLINILSIYDSLAYIDFSNTYYDNFGLYFGDNLFSTLSSSYGPIVGIIIGCVSIASERHNHALNTLLVKPVYRDTIINGKLLGMLMFLLLVIGFSILLYTSALFVLCGDVFASALMDYLCRLPAVFLFSLIVLAIYLSWAILLSLLIKNQAFAMIIGSILVYIAYLVPTMNFALVVSNLFPGKEQIVYNLLVSVTPGNYFPGVRSNLFNSSNSIFSSLQLILPDMAQFLLYSIVAIVLSYIIFIRGDEA